MIFVSTSTLSVLYFHHYILPMSGFPHAYSLSPSPLQTRPSWRRRACCRTPLWKAAGRRWMSQPCLRRPPSAASNGKARTQNQPFRSAHMSLSKTMKHMHNHYTVPTSCQTILDFYEHYILLFLCQDGSFGPAAGAPAAPGSFQYAAAAGALRRGASSGGGCQHQPADRAGSARRQG